MRAVLSQASGEGRRVAAVIGACHASALVGAGAPGAAVSGTDGASSSSAPETLRAAAPPTTTSLVPYAFDLLDARSGYPAGIRDPRWQQAVFTAAGDPERITEAAARAITSVCRELRAAGHTAGTGEAAETLRLASDLARLRALPAPGRGEVL